MTASHRDLNQRRPVWEALAILFADHDLEDWERRAIAANVVASGYSPDEIQIILWDEVFPFLECWLRSPLGGCSPSIDWLEKRILEAGPRQQGQSQERNQLTAQIIKDEWAKIASLLPIAFREQP